jgi:hypothetical protein
MDRSVRTRIWLVLEIGAVIALGGALLMGAPPAQILLAIGAALLGALLTLLALDRLAVTPVPDPCQTADIMPLAWEQPITPEGEQRARLIAQMGSTDNRLALDAIRVLRDKGWLTGDALMGAFLGDASLQGADLTRANLRCAFLFGADLTGAVLDRANLQGANLYEAALGGTRLVEARLHNANLFRANLQSAALTGAALQNAILGGADLRGAHLDGANLQGAVLGGANLRAATLTGARLQRANLEGASLRDADLLGAGFDANTILPNGERWTPATDMTQFTAPGTSSTDLPVLDTLEAPDDTPSGSPEG